MLKKTEKALSFSLSGIIPQILAVSFLRCPILSSLPPPRHKPCPSSSRLCRESAAAICSGEKLRFSPAAHEEISSSRSPEGGRSRKSIATAFRGIEFCIAYLNTSMSILLEEGQHVRWLVVDGQQLFELQSVTAHDINYGTYGV
ncbi:hypothetical protein ACLOJK_017649 [Asimina triloba]